MININTKEMAIITEVICEKIKIKQKEIMDIVCTKGY